MALYDLPLEELERYRPELRAPDDFDDFWRHTLAETEALGAPATFVERDTPLRTVDVMDVTFSGYGGHPVKGWLLLPRGHAGPLPCVVEYIGYGGGRGLPHEWLLWASAGYAHFVMDTRGQGSAWRRGDTPDPGSGDDASGAPHYPGFMTQGASSPSTHYFRRLFADAERAVAAAREHPRVNAERVAVTGASQGGGLALAVAGLVKDVAAAMPDVPFLCHMRRGAEMTDALPYAEIRRYLTVHRDRAEALFATLAYFDGVHFAERAQAPALFAVALMDQVCPPSTVYAAFNRYAGDKRLRRYDFNDHEGGGSAHELEKLAFAERWLAPR